VQTAHSHARALIRRLGPPMAAGAVVAGSVVTSGALRGRPASGAPPLAAAAVSTPVKVWEQVLPGAGIRESSPTPGVLDGGGPSVVVGSLNGKVYAFHESDGSATPGWPQQTTNGIDSSPSIADTNGDGAKLDEFFVDDAGVVHVTVSKRAKSYLLHNFKKTRGWYEVRLRATAQPASR